MATAGLRDVLFGMVTSDVGVFPQGVADLDAINDLFEIVLSIAPGEMPWLGVSGDVSPILFEQMGREEIARVVSQRLSVTCAKFIPLVEILDVSLIEPLSASELAVEVVYNYRGQEGSAQVKL